MFYTLSDLSAFIVKVGDFLRNKNLLLEVSRNLSNLQGRLIGCHPYLSLQVLRFSCNVQVNLYQLLSNKFHPFFRLWLSIILKDL